MSEAEIINLLTATEENFQGLLEWWAGISLGVIVLSHVAARKLNWFLVSLVLVLYVTFSIVFVYRIGFLLEFTGGLLAELEQLRVSGNASLAAERLLELDPRAPPTVVSVSYLIQIVGLFVATVGYLIFRHYKDRRSTT